MQTITNIIYTEKAKIGISDNTFSKIIITKAASAFRL